MLKLLMGAIQAKLPEQAKRNRHAGAYPQRYGS